MIWFFLYCSRDFNFDIIKNYHENLFHIHSSRMSSSGFLLFLSWSPNKPTNFLEPDNFFLGSHFKTLLSFEDPLWEISPNNPLKSLSFDYFLSKSILLFTREFIIVSIFDLDFAKYCFILKLGFSKIELSVISTVGLNSVDDLSNTWDEFFII